MTETWKKPPSNLIALYYLNLKEDERPLCYPTLTKYFSKITEKNPYYERNN